MLPRKVVGLKLEMNQMVTLRLVSVLRILCEKHVWLPTTMWHNRVYTRMLSECGQEMRPRKVREEVSTALRSACYSPAS